MERNILIEVNRVREIMGLDLLIKEQEVDTNPDVIRTIDGDEYKVTTTDIEPFKSGKWSATFPAGKYKGGDITGSLDSDIQKLAVWLDNPALVNTSIVVSINAGSSRTPIGVGGALDKELKALGKPGNQGLAELRAETAVNLVKPKLQAVIAPEIFKNITWVIDVSQVEQGPEFVPGVDKASHEKYVPYQFLSATAGVTGQEETLEKIPKWCENAKVGKKGGGTGVEEKGWRAVKDNDYMGAEYDMGEGEAVINLLFNSFTVPDMFQVTYNDVVYTSKGPDGKIGFVSGAFNGLTEREELRYMEKLKKIKDKIMGTEEGSKSGSKVRGKAWRDYGYIFKHNGVPIRDDKTVDILWLNAFFKEFPPANGKPLKDIKPGKEKYNSKFSKHPLDSPEEKELQAAGTYVPDKQTIKAFKGFWKMVQEASKKLRGKMDDLVQEYEDMEKKIVKLRAGDPTAYAWWRSRELKRIGKNNENIPAAAKEGFINGVIGDQGIISFTKVPGVNKFYVQVYAPFGGTAWRADVRCDKVEGSSSFESMDRDWIDDVKSQVNINRGG